jgi:glucose/arabinose dehydrogenase
MAILSHIKTIFSAILLILFLLSCQSKQTEVKDTPKILTLPQGFTATIVADNLGRGRHIDVNDNGDIYMMLSRDKDGMGIVALRDQDKDGKAEIIKYFGTRTGTGIKIHNGYLYHSTPTAIYRNKMTPGELIPAPEPELVVGGFPEQGQHNTKPFTFDNMGNMYVTVGGPSNACQEETRTPGSPGQDPCPQLILQGGIWRFSADKLNQDHENDGYRYATGIRNAVAIDWNNTTNKLYAVQHGRDQLSQLWPDYYTDKQSAELPSEEFLLVNDGSDFGWPYSYYDHLQGKKMLAPEYGGDGKKEADPKFEDPILAFPGHYAPNDLIFYSADQFPDKYKNGAFIAFHGSWNRGPFEQKGYCVAFVPFSGDKPDGDWEVFADGFMGDKPIMSSGEAKHRPMGLAQDIDGSLLISDSVKGTIWRITYSGN